MTIPFKSLRAAKIAYTKAEKAYGAARDAVLDYTSARRELGYRPDDPEYKRLEAVVGTTKAAMRAVYEQATAEGHHIQSWHCGPNETRDLIAANRD